MWYLGRRDVALGPERASLQGAMEMCSVADV